MKQLHKQARDFMHEAKLQEVELYGDDTTFKFKEKHHNFSGQAWDSGESAPCVRWQGPGSTELEVAFHHDPAALANKRRNGGYRPLPENCTMFVHKNQQQIAQMPVKVSQDGQLTVIPELATGIAAEALKADPTAHQTLNQELNDKLPELGPILQEELQVAQDRKNYEQKYAHLSQVDQGKPLISDLSDVPPDIAQPSHIEGPEGPTRHL